MSDENEQADSLPQPLVDKLKSTDQALPLITARVDRDISAMARNHFSSRRRSAWKPRPAWAAMAATVLLAVLFVQLQNRGTPDTAAMYPDVDRSGRVDIADVLALARTQPGKSSQAELDAFAMRIVSLKRTGDAS